MSLVNQTPKLGRLLLTGIGLFFVWFSIWVLVTPFYNDPCMSFNSFAALETLNSSYALDIKATTRFRSVTGRIKVTAIKTI